MRTTKALALIFLFAITNIAVLLPWSVSPALAAFTVTISGSPGAGQITMTLMGTATPTVPGFQANTELVANGSLDLFSHGGGGASSASSVSGNCSDSSETGGFSTGSVVISDGGVGPKDTIAINFNGSFTFAAGDPVTCSASFTFNIDINTVLTANLPLLAANVSFGFPGQNFTVNLAGPVPSGPNAQDKSNTIAALQNAFNAATPGLLNGGLPLNGTVNGNANGLNFSPTGLGFSQSRIDANNPMDRDYGPAFVRKGYFGHLGQTSRNNGFNFSVDLNQMAKAANDNEALGVHHGAGMKDGPDQPHSRLNPFVTGQWVDFDDDEANADRDGHLWVITSGFSYRVSQATTIGVFSRYRDGEADSNALTASLDSEYYGGGLFLSTTLGGGLRVGIAGLYEEGDNDITIGGATGSFDSESTTFEARIDKRLTRGRTWIEPAVSIRYIDTEQDNYTDSTGTLVTNQDLTLGRLTYGPTIGTTIQHGTTQVKPFAKVNGVWDFENDGNFATSTAGIEVVPPIWTVWQPG